MQVFDLQCTRKVDQATDKEETKMKTMNVGTPAEYAKAAKMMLRAGCATPDELNEANHMALEKKLITLAHFQAVAKVLVAEMLKR